jgi:precorrin-2 dehydrogenase/sirohydrochlorin ferrochelatase
MQLRTIVPVGLDLTGARIGVVGRDRQAINRLDLLERFEVRTITVWSDAPSTALAQRAGHLLRQRLPRSGEVAGLTLLFVGDLPKAEAAPLARTARIAGVLVNVEDIPSLCDFHVPAVVKRGDLTVTVSTRGLAPGLAAQIRRYLEARLDAEWGERLKEITALRHELRRHGLDPSAVARQIADHVQVRGWLPDGPGAPNGQP